MKAIRAGGDLELPKVVRKSSSPRILYLSPPWPYKSIRSLHVAQALRQIGDVEVVVVYAEGKNWGTREIIENDFKLAYELDVLPRPKKGLGQKLVSAINAHIPYPHGLGVDQQGDERVRESLRDFDIIWFFKLRTSNMFRSWRWPRSVLDIDDLPSSFHRTAWRASASLKDRFLSGIQVISWKRRERLLGDRFTVLAVCSEADKRCLRIKAPIHTIPNGFDRPYVEPIHRPVSPPTFGFIGLFDYVANLEGIRWFADECWPRVKRALPEARLRLVGRGSDGPHRPKRADIDGLGWIDDAEGEIATWSAMIVPLLMGGGTRVKIAEGFSRKCPIVSTRVGAYGYDVENGRELRLADTPDDFSQACIDLACNPIEAAQMAKRAWNAFLEKWTWDAIAPRVWDAAEDCLRRSSKVRS
jgi:glycosyltransferase involved in cell wall biosynthesis